MDTVTTNVTKSDYIAYEYKSVVANKDLTELYEDSYKSFGWKTVEKKDGIEGTTIKLKRDREIENRTELVVLQKNFETEVKNIEKFTVQKTQKAMLVSLSTGIVGTAFMAGATFAYLAATPMIALMVPLAIVGFVGWIAPYFINKYIKKRQAIKLTPQIDGAYDNIYGICKQARKLWV